MNIKSYLGLNSFNVDTEGRKWSHREIYGSIVKAIGLETCIKYIPASREQIIKALQTDEHLNNIPLHKWDFQYGQFKHEFIKIGINVLSVAGIVCTLKEAARLWAEAEVLV